MNDTVKNVLLWVILALALVAVFTRYMPPTGKPEEVRYSTFLKEVHDGRVDSVVLQGDTIYGVRKDKSKFQAYNPETKRTFVVQVKSLRSKNFFLISRDKVEPGHMYVFVLLNRPDEQVQYFVVSGADLCAL